MGFTKLDNEIVNRNFKICVDEIDRMCAIYDLPPIECDITNRVYRMLAFNKIYPEKHTDKIYFGKKPLRYLTLKQLKSVARHEALHYICFKLGKPYNDGDEYFENMLDEYDAPSNSRSPIVISDSQYEMENRLKNKNVKKHVYNYHVYCLKCGRDFVDPKKNFLTMGDAKEMIKHCHCICGGKLTKERLIYR